MSLGYLAVIKQDCDLKLIKQNKAKQRWKKIAEINEISSLKQKMSW